MPSITEMPNSAMKPIAAETLNGLASQDQRQNAADHRHRDDAQDQQRLPQGVEMDIEQQRISARLRGTTTISRPIASCRLPNSPTQSSR